MENWLGEVSGEAGSDKGKGAGQRVLRVRDPNQDRSDGQR